MSRPYDNLPRQGEHLDDPVDAEPTTNVRAQQPAHPPSRSKETDAVHVLLAERSAGRFRLVRVPVGSVEAETNGYEVIDQVPDAGDVDRLYGHLPDQPNYAVFENTRKGNVYYAPDRRVEGDWTNDSMFDRVTIFTEKGDAESFVEERRSSDD